MMKRSGRLTLLCLAFATAGCGGTINPSIPRGAEAYAIFPAGVQGQARQEYRLGALDTIDVNVFQEPELSTRQTPIDASGTVTLPLVGSLRAAGKTTTELSAEIARRLGETYLVDPQVSVVVAQSVSQKISVQGEVTEPGVYEIKGGTTLLEAISLAKGETRVAELKEVVVFRMVGGQRFGGVFDVRSIRRGDAEDPQLRGNDVVIVGHSARKSIWRDFISAAPVLNVFRPF